MAPLPEKPLVTGFGVSHRRGADRRGGDKLNKLTSFHLVLPCFKGDWINLHNKTVGAKCTQF